MRKKYSILAVIPARGGSKSIPFKNLILTGGRPLISYAIEAAKKSKYIDRIIVSTDDRSIARYSVESGIAVPFLRPKRLSKDASPTSEAVIHAIKWLERHKQTFDIVIVLEPTSPLRKDADIDAAIDLFVKNYDRADALVSVGEVHMEHPYITKCIDHGFVKPLFPDIQAFHQRQQLPDVYFPYGVAYISKVATYIKTKTFYQEKTIPYFIERWQNYELDDTYDHMCIERIMQSGKKPHKRKELKITGLRVEMKSFSMENLHDKRYGGWLRDKDVVRTIGRFEYFKSVQFAEIESYVQKLLNSDADYFFALHLRHGNKFIGTVKLGSIDWNNKTADVGIMIGDKTCWGKGLATETITLLCGYAFKHLRLRKLTGGCLSGNIAMIKCFQRVGFIREGIRRKQYWDGTMFTDHVVYGLLKKEFRPRPQS